MRNFAETVRYDLDIYGRYSDKSGLYGVQLDTPCTNGESADACMWYCDAELQLTAIISEVLTTEVAERAIALAQAELKAGNAIGGLAAPAVIVPGWDADDDPTLPGYELDYIYGKDGGAMETLSWSMYVVRRLSEQDDKNVD